MNNIMNNKMKIGILFERNNEKIIPSISIDDLENISETINSQLKMATEIYLSSIERMNLIFKKNTELRQQKKHVPARLMWQFGDEIFSLINKLNDLGFRWDNLYESLIRDLKVSYTTIKRVIMFRKHVNNINLIPENINWGALKDSPKKYLNNLNKFK